MKSHRISRMGVTLSTVLILMVSTTLLTSVVVRGEEIKVGLIYPVSGPIASIGQLCVNGHEFAVNQINAQGGIQSLGGAKIKLIIADTEGKPEVGMAECEKLINEDKVVAIMGAYQSGVTFPTTQVAEKFQTPYIVPLAVADPITDRGFKYIFRTNFKASWNAKWSLDILKWLGENTGKMARTVVMLYEDTLWGQSTAEMWKPGVPEYGFELVGDFPYSKAATDVSPTISKIKGLKPDCVLQVSYTTDAILITRTMHELDFNCMARIPSGGGHSDPRFIRAVGDLGENIIVNQIFHHTLKGPGTKIQDTNAEYKAIYNEDMDDYSATSYNAIWVLKDALERAASTDRDKVRDALAKTNINVNNSPVIQPYEFKFDETGQCPGAIGVATQFQNGEMVAIYPDEFAASKSVYPMPTWKQRGLR